MSNRIYPIRWKPGWARGKRSPDVVVERPDELQVEMPDEVNVIVLRDGTRVWIGSGEPRRKKDVV